jgi:hypothetical protein
LAQQMRCSRRKAAVASHPIPAGLTGIPARPNGNI